MAAAVSATSTPRFVSLCCGAGACSGFGGGLLPSLGPGGAVLEACGCKTLLGAVVSASGLASGLGFGETVKDGVLTVRAS